MNIKIILIPFLIILLVSGITAALNPLIPAGYYGSITVNGQPASPGTTIIAKMGGAERGNITTTTSGSYGGPEGPSQKLAVIGYEGDNGSIVTFYVKNVAAQQTTTWISGEIKQVDLTFVGLPIPPGGGPGGPSNGGAAGGGGGITSGEPFENIEFSETQEADLRMGIPITFRFRDPRHVVYEIVITANTSAGLTGAKIEQLKGTSRLVTSPPPGAIFKNVNIWLGSSGFAVPRNIREGIVRFRVNNSWLSGENVEEVSMMRWDGSTWNSLETRQINRDGTFTYYEAMTDIFSPFAVRGVKAEATGTIPTRTTSQPSPSGEIPVVKPPTALNWVLYVLVALVIIAAGYYFVLRKK